jgi:hypothetical protein
MSVNLFFIQQFLLVFQHKNSEFIDVLFKKKLKRHKYSQFSKENRDVLSVFYDKVAEKSIKNTII